MLHRIHQRLPTLFIVLLLAPTAIAGAAETLIMDNGDRLNGHLVCMSDQVLEFETVYAGKIRVNWNNIREIRSDGTFAVRLPGNEVKPVSSLIREDDRVLLDGQTVPGMNVTQINPADWEIGRAARLSGEIDAGFKLERGNTYENRTDVMSRMEWKKMRHRIRLGGEFEYGKSDGVLTSERWSIETAYDNSASRHIYYGAATSLKSDRMSDLNLRWATGPHIGYRFIETTRTGLNAETGLEYATEDYRSQHLNTFLADSWKFEFSHFLIPGKLQVYHRNSGLVSLTDGGGLSVDTWNGLKLPITAGLSTSAEIKTTYNGNAPAIAKLWDTVYRFKVGYQW